MMEHHSLLTDEYRLQALWLTTSSNANGPDCDDDSHDDGNNNNNNNCNNEIPAKTNNTTIFGLNDGSPQAWTRRYLMKGISSFHDGDNVGDDDEYKQTHTRIKMITATQNHPAISFAKDTTNNKPSLSFPLCRDCGAPLQPGWNGCHVVALTASSLTSAKAGTARHKDANVKTRARRQRRQRLKETIQAKQQQQQKQQKHGNATHGSSRQPVKNHLILQCGFCTTRLALPGNPKKRKRCTYDKSAEQSATTSRYRNTNKKKKKGQLKQEKGNEGSTLEGQFVKLPPKEPPLKMAAAIPSSTASFRSKKPPTTLAAAAGKKKKPKKSNLMEFLTSLND